LDNPRVAGPLVAVTLRGAGNAAGHAGPALHHAVFGNECQHEILGAGLSFRSRDGLASPAFRALDCAFRRGGKLQGSIGRNSCNSTT